MVSSQTSLSSSLPATTPAYGAIYLVPYLILMFCRVSNFGAQALEGAPDDSSLKIVLEGFAYALAAVLVGIKFPNIRVLLGRLLPFYLYALYAAVTWFWSGHPDSVLLRVGHMIGLLVVAVSVALWAQDRRDKFLVWTASFMWVALALSVVAVYFLPNRGLSHPEYNVTGNSRWMGITGHPNLLGAVAIVGVWSGIAVIALRKSLGLRWLAGSLLVLSAAALRGSDSRSSALTAIFCAALFYSLRGANAATALPTFMRRFLVVAGIGGVLIATAFLIDPDFVMAHLSPSARAGASDALSDRPLIWALGLEAFRDNPFGWTYDLLASYWDLHGRLVIFPHFHNGFLDVAVKGGFIGEFFLLAMLARMAFGVRALLRVDFELAVIYGTFFISNLLYNVIDTGFDREAILWPMMMAAWAVVEATLLAQHQKVPRRVVIVPPARISTRATAHWASHRTGDGI